MTKGELVAVRSDKVELLFDFLDAEGVLWGILRYPNGKVSVTRPFDTWTKVGDWKPVSN